MRCMSQFATPESREAPARTILSPHESRDDLKPLQPLNWIPE